MSLAKTRINPALDANWRLRAFIANYGVYIALLVLLLAAAVLTPKLYAVNTIAVVMRQASQLGIVAIGQTMILLVAGLDLSIGGIFIMTSIVVAEVTNGRDEMVIPAILISLALKVMQELGIAPRDMLSASFGDLLPATAILLVINGAMILYLLGILRKRGREARRESHEARAGYPQTASVAGR